MKTLRFCIYALALGAGSSALAQTYSLKLFPGTSVNGVNSSGEVVGTLAGSDSQGPSPAIGFTYANRKFTEFNAPAAGNDAGGTYVSGLNVNGEILGSYMRVDPKQVNGNFLLSKSGTYTYFGNALSSSATSINSHGLDDVGDIVGDVLQPGGTYVGFKLSGGTYTYFSVPGQLTTVAYGINNIGQIAGEAGDQTTSAFQGFIYQNGAFTLINHPNAHYTILTGINDAGVAAGYYFPIGGSTADFVGFTYVNGVFTDLPFSQLGSVQVLGINNLGEVYGSYVLGERSGGFVAVPVTGGGAETVETINLPSAN